MNGAAILWRWKMVERQINSETNEQTQKPINQPIKITSPPVDVELINPLGYSILKKAIKSYDSINYAQFFEFGIESLLNNSFISGMLF